MLFGISAQIHPTLLHAMSTMGHGDELVVCDANFPASSVASTTQLGEVIQSSYQTASDAVADILKLMPLDAFVDNPAVCMEVPGNHAESPIVHQEVNVALATAPGNPWSLAPLDRFKFYERAKKAYCVVRSLERRPYGCFVLVKGVLTPDGDLMTPEYANKV